jgi:2-methylcitrate dehydratase
MNETKDLASWIVDLKLGDIPAQVIDYAKLLLLDTVGCMLGGSLQESNRAALRYMRAMGGSPQATVVNYGDATNVYNAAFLNGSFGHGWDFDDHLAGGSPHSMSATTAAAMAVGEWQLSSGRAFLEAWIAGYEANNRIGAACGRAFGLRGFHHVGTIGSFAGTAVASKLLRLDEWKTENAISITVSQAAGTFQHSRTTGGAIKRNHMGFAASNGVRSALLAMEGITGPREALEGECGFVVCHSGKDNDMAAISRSFGNEWYTPRAAMKNYSNCAAMWGLLDLLYKLIGKHGLKAEAIESMTFGLRPSSAAMVGTIKGEEVQDIFGAQFSARYSVGMAFVLGDNRPTSYKSHVYPYGKWREIVEVSKKVVVAADAEAEAQGIRKKIYGYTRCEIRLKDGGVIRAESESAPKGLPSNPMTQQERLDKYYGQALMVVGRKQADEVRRIVEGIETMDDIRPLMRLLVNRAGIAPGSNAAPADY